MFHTFETAQYNTPSQQDANATASVKRRTSTVRACEPCRRRKIRCNGEHPCETCQWYRKAASCHYTEPRPRQVPSRRSVEKISQTLQEYRAILQKLFPSVHPEQLAGMSRENLIDLISKTGPFQAPSPLSPGHDEKHHIPQSDAGSLEQLQPLPEEAQDFFQSDARQRSLTGLSEDVNLQSLKGNESSSYLGISSVMAVLRVILWLDPECKTFVAKDLEPAKSDIREYSRTPSGLGPLSSPSSIGQLNPSWWNEPAIIDAYFEYLHPATPLIDEQIFRHTYTTASRNDSRWLLLVNSVLAVGSIAASTSSTSAAHEYYFTLAREQLTVETLGSAHIETVQSLALLAGYYLHYIQEPNLATAIMGATLRMSTMLGLHRDFSEGLGSTKTDIKTQKTASSIEMRRRIWWSIFMLDAWVGSTLGRPSMGRTSQAVTSRVPQDPIDGSQTHVKLMQESVRFCQISTRVEDSLAICPTIDELERQSLDAALVDWYQHSSVQSQQPANSTVQHYNSPRSTTSSTHQQQIETPGITMTKNHMRWRYHLSRIILHRPALLWWAMRSHRQATSPQPSKVPILDPSRRAAIAICRAVTSELIIDICANWTSSSLPASTMSAWQAIWLLYQAVMVPLLLLFSEAQDDEVTKESRQLIEVSIDTLEEMQQWCNGAKRSLEVVRAIYAASRRHSPETTHTMLPLQDSDVLLGGRTDDLLDPMSMDTWANGSTSASASVSGGMSSSGLGTPATLPSSVSSHHLHHHNHHLQQPQPRSSTHQEHQQKQQKQQKQQQHTAYTTQQPYHHQQQQRPTFIDLPPLSLPCSSSSPFSHPEQQHGPSHHQAGLHHDNNTTHSNYHRTTTHRQTPNNNNNNNNNYHHHHHHHHPFIHPSTTPSASSTSAHSQSAYLESSTTTLLENLGWSQGWSDTNYPFETPRLGWDPCAIHGWVGGGGGGGGDDDDDNGSFGGGDGGGGVGVGDAVMGAVDISVGGGAGGGYGYFGGEEFDMRGCGIVGDEAGLGRVRSGGGGGGRIGSSTGAGGGLTGGE